MFCRNLPSRQTPFERINTATHSHIVKTAHFLPCAASTAACATTSACATVPSAAPLCGPWSALVHWINTVSRSQHERALQFLNSIVSCDDLWRACRVSCCVVPPARLSQAFFGKEQAESLAQDAAIAGIHLVCACRCSFMVPRLLPSWGGDAATSLAPRRAAASSSSGQQQQRRGSRR